MEEARCAALYEEAETLLMSGDYDNAEKMFSDLGDYSDAITRIDDVKEARNNALYLEAIKIKEEKQYQQAYEAFKSLNEYSDSAEQAKDCALSYAKEQQSAGQTDSPWLRKI